MSPTHELDALPKKARALARILAALFDEEGSDKIAVEDSTLAYAIRPCSKRWTRDMLAVLADTGALSFTELPAKGPQPPGPRTIVRQPDHLLWQIVATTKENEK
jgi:hypothetical protein